ncbi:hypothetical protein [Aestuariivivens sediminis]|uniref:hypothetical protein n=1 Tax=Aestuariivivens sediminis TaxID=2913557 RepID=UPI001F59CD11|nr:hypothetical protein [Aestuariivivens sediminis]
MKIINYVLIILLLTSCVTENKDGKEKEFLNQDIEYKVGLLGAPSYPDVEWNDENMQTMKDLGFNTMQLNIAWGYRPGDDPLNLEDVLELPEKFKLPIDIDTTLNKNVGSSKTFIRTKDKISVRAKELKHRVAICKKYGFRSIFHFGAPFVAYPANEPLSQCISNDATIDRYTTLIKNFHKEFSGVDDLLIYTYDQNAWLCSEYGPCERCHGVPLDERVSKFINTLASTWKSLNGDGRVWWEPWEISAGQTFSIVDKLDPESVGLSLHSSIAEVQIAIPADRWFKNLVNLANENNIPVLGEVWMGSATEEVEPYINIPTPLATLKALRAVNNSGKLKGIKEYYGNIPNREDVNLRMTSIFFSNPDISDNEALKQLAEPYGEVADKVAEFWEYSSEAIELYPWDISWNSREIGRIDPIHLMSAATLKGVSWETPSWQSNRRAGFMRTSETEEPHYWMLEDAQLRFEKSAEKIGKALSVANEIKDDVPNGYRESFNSSITELTSLRKALLSYVYHIRETNLSSLMRSSLKNTGKIKESNLNELRSILKKDIENQGTSEFVGPALDLLESDVNQFLDTYFKVTPFTGQRNVWSVTSK